MSTKRYDKNLQLYKFSAYGFLKNLRFFEPFLLLFLLENGMSYLQIGTIYGLREIMINVFEIPSGILADATGRRRTMVVAFILYCISFVIFYYSTSYGWFLAAMTVFAMGDAFRSGVHKAMIFHYLKRKGWQDQKVFYYGYTRSWSQIGYAVSALAAGLIVFYQDSYRSIFLFTIIPFVLDMFLIMSYPSWLDGEREKPRWNEVSERFRSIGRAFLVAFRSTDRIKAVMNVSVYSGFYKAGRDYLQALVKTMAPAIPLFYGFTRQDKISVVVGISYFVVFILSSIAARHSGSFTQRFKNIYLPLNLTLIAGFGMGIIAGIGKLALLPLLSLIPFVLIIVIENLRKPLGISYVANKTSSQVHASVMSAQSQMKSIIAAVVALALGFLSDQLGVGYALIIVSAVFILLLPFYAARGRKQKID